ncbi:hypothetical protein GC087_17235 [Pantoea sp. JZ2]|uniref:hypothetical protein n=1 Tax=Pantoea sp. JZ2 TaxID=2654189 RepID=UPI002B4894CE|nr:hypothetical protein [Pantoea sp. JZ2]WRH15331.1 hypothetical protein GC087_17235 [Pantoea sp. JZ2]
MLTKNYRLNALANSYATALYHHVKAQNGGDHFYTMAHDEPLRVDIIGGIVGMRQLIDSYFLEALKVNYRGWEAIGLATLGKCLSDEGSLTPKGISFWESMVSDMGATVEGNENA